MLMLKIYHYHPCHNIHHIFFFFFGRSHHYIAPRVKRYWKFAEREAYSKYQFSEESCEHCIHGRHDRRSFKASSDTSKGTVDYIRMNACCILWGCIIFYLNDSWRFELSCSNRKVMHTWSSSIWRPRRRPWVDPQKSWDQIMEQNTLQEIEFLQGWRYCLALDNNVHSIEWCCEQMNQTLMELDTC